MQYCYEIVKPGMNSAIGRFVAADAPQEVRVEVEMKIVCVRSSVAWTDASVSSKYPQGRHVQTSGCPGVSLSRVLIEPSIWLDRQP